MKRQIPACPKCSKPLFLLLNYSFYDDMRNQHERIWRHVNNVPCDGELTLDQWPRELSDHEERAQRNFKSRTRYAKAKWERMLEQALQRLAA